MVCLSFLPDSHFYPTTPSFTCLQSTSPLLFKNISPHLTPSLLPSSFVQNVPYGWDSECYQSAKTTGGADMGQIRGSNIPVAAKYKAHTAALLECSRKYDGFRRGSTKSQVDGPVHHPVASPLTSDQLAPAQSQSVHIPFTKTPSPRLLKDGLFPISTRGRSSTGSTLWGRTGLDSGGAHASLLHAQYAARRL